jgi:predicted DNA-binding ribbon-helix-helix protein
MVEIIRLSVAPITTPECPDPTPRARRVRSGDRTITLYAEAALWDVLDRIAREEGVSTDQLCSDIADVTAPDVSFAQAARCYVRGHIIDQIPDDLLPPELLELRRHGYRRSVQ